MTCDLCGGELVLLGQLGCITHFRCRCCGMTCSEFIEEDLT